MAGLARLDAFSKSIAGAQEKTRLGAVVSLAAYALMAYLLFSEYMLYLDVRIVEKLLLDHDHERVEVPVSLDIEFLKLPCDKIHLLYRNANSPKVAVDLSESVTKTEGIEQGCQVKGRLKVPKVRGILEVSLNHAGDVNDQQQQQLHGSTGWDQVMAFDASHVVNKLSFGKTFGSRDPLDKHEGKRDDGPYQYQYQVKVVPTSFTSLGLDKINHDEYSATYYYKKTEDPRKSFGLFQSVEMPGLYIRFEFSPISIAKREVKRTFLQFLTSVCAVVGGVYAAAGLIDMTLHGVVSAKKID